MELEEEEEETQLNSKKPRMWPTATAPNEIGRSSYKTQLCRRFKEGACPLGPKCTYAHGVSDLRRTHLHQEPKLCRMFSFNKHCTYGHNCRFLHSVSSSSSTHSHQHQFNNAPFHPHAHAQPQPAGGKHEGYSSAEYGALQTSAAAAANASTSNFATSSLHKNEQPYRVKFIFKENELRKISGIYADWI